jgi:hypothetical protein
LVRLFCVAAILLRGYPIPSRYDVKKSGDAADASAHPDELLVSYEYGVMRPVHDPGTHSGHVKVPKRS